MFQEKKKKSEHTVLHSCRTKINTIHLNVTLAGSWPCLRSYPADTSMSRLFLAAW